jgi:hypothetical protein
MATYFSVIPGYAWGEPTTPEQILDAARSVSMEALRAKCIEYGLENMVDETGSGLDDYIKCYESIPSSDLTIRADENGIFSVASGGDISRVMKERIRRAFMILVVDECFRRGLSVHLGIT